MNKHHIIKTLFRASRNRYFSQSCKCMQSEPLTIPVSDAEIQPASPKIQKLVEDITKLTLVEVVELSKTLKTTLNLPDAPLMSFAGAAAPSAAEKEEDDVASKIVKTSYTVKLTKFDETKKVALIKEVKTLVENMNLVQAKKFVESVPVVVKANIGKEEADNLKELLEKNGATVEIA